MCFLKYTRNDLPIGSCDLSSTTRWNIKLMSSFSSHENVDTSCVALAETIVNILIWVLFYQLLPAKKGQKAYVHGNSMASSFSQNVTKSNWMWEKPCQCKKLMEKKGVEEKKNTCNTQWINKQHNDHHSNDHDKCLDDHNESSLSQMTITMKMMMKVANLRTM